MRRSTLVFLLLVFSMVPESLEAQEEKKAPKWLKGFTLPNANDGQDFNLNKLKNSKAVVLVFNSAHCSYSDNYVARINGLYESYSPKGVAFVALNSNDPSISQDDSFTSMAAHRPFHFPYLKDKDQKVAHELGATKNPEAFVLLPDSQGFKVVYQGKIDDMPVMTHARVAKNLYLTEALEQVLAGQPVTQPYTSPEGCNIKWKME